MANFVKRVCARDVRQTKPIQEEETGENWTADERGTAPAGTWWWGARRRRGIDWSSATWGRWTASVRVSWPARCGRWDARPRRCACEPASTPPSPPPPTPPRPHPTASPRTRKGRRRTDAAAAAAGRRKLATRAATTRWRTAAVDAPENTGDVPRRPRPKPKLKPKLLRNFFSHRWTMYTHIRFRPEDCGQ